MRSALIRTPESILDATAEALRPLGPFRQGLDVCCGTGAGIRVLEPLCDRRVTGVDFSTGMLAQARIAHPDAEFVRADVRALPFTEEFDLAVRFGALGYVDADDSGPRFLNEATAPFAPLPAAHRATKQNGRAAAPQGNDTAVNDDGSHTAGGAGAEPPQPGVPGGRPPGQT